MNHVASVYHISTNIHNENIVPSTTIRKNRWFVYWRIKWNNHKDSQKINQILSFNDT